MTEEVTPFSNVVSKRRLDYDSKLGEWRRLDGYVYYRNTFIYGNHYNFYWWDEFKITEEKIVKKLKF